MQRTASAVRPSLRHTLRTAALCGLLACTASRGAMHRGVAAPYAATDAYAPGARTLLDAHNAYPERGLWSDRLDRALSTGLPVAIEQDLHWHAPRGSAPLSVVAHDDDALPGAPALRTHFFERIRPLMEQEIARGARDTWPVVVLNLDFKDNKPEHLEHVWALLGEYEAWLTTAPRTATPGRPERLAMGPLLVLCGSDTAQRRRFHDEVAVGARLRAFGAMRPAPVSGVTRSARARRAIAMSPAQHIDRHADNYARWVNFPWTVVEAGGQNAAGPWTATDSARLSALVGRAHERQFWIRFYTLDGFGAGEDRGYTAAYNFGSRDAARARWRAATDARVDFVATDQYEEFAAERVAREGVGRREPSRSGAACSAGSSWAPAGVAPTRGPTPGRSTTGC